MDIRLANREDIPAITEIYSRAREFMRSTGNPSQWTGGYPSEEVVEEGIRGGKHYVCMHGGETAGTFWFGAGPDPTYEKIYGDGWLNDAPYGVVHRLASGGKFRGVADFCLKWCLEQAGNIRVDTHRDNLVMQSILEKNGYTRCGIIFLPGGTERTAFQKCR